MTSSCSSSCILMVKMNESTMMCWEVMPDGVCVESVKMWMTSSVKNSLCWDAALFQILLLVIVSLDNLSTNFGYHIIPTMTLA